MASFDLQRNDKGEASWVDPRSGETFWVPQDRFDQVYQAGLRPEAPAAYAERQKRKELSSPWLGAGLGVLSGVSAGLLPAALAETGIIPGKTQRIVREESPWAFGLSDVAGTLGGALTAGPVALAGRLSTKVAAKTALKTGSKALGKAAGFGAEGALYSAGKGVEDLAVHDVDTLSEEGVKHLAKTVGVGGGAGLILGTAGMGLMKAAGAAGRTTRKLLDGGGDRRIARMHNSLEVAQGKFDKVNGQVGAVDDIVAKFDDTIQIKQTQAAALDAERAAIQGAQAEGVQAHALHGRLGREIDEALGPWGMRRNAETGRPEMGLQPRYSAGDKGKAASLSKEAHRIKSLTHALDEGEFLTTGKAVTAENAPKYRAELTQLRAQRQQVVDEVFAKQAQQAQLRKTMEGLDPNLITKLDDIGARKGKILDELDDAVRGKQDQLTAASQWKLDAEDAKVALDKLRQDVKLETAGSIGRAIGMLQRVAIRARGHGMMFGGAAVMGGGGAMGIMAGMIAPNAMEMLAKYATRVVTSPAGMRVGAKLQRATAALGSPKVSTGLRTATESILTDEDFKTIRQEVSRFDPKLYLESAAIAADQTGMVAEVAELSDRVIKAQTYLQETISQPPADEAKRVSPAEWTPSDSQKRADRARIEGALNPDRVLMSIAEETLKPEHVEALLRVHPDVLEMARSHVGQGIEERKLRGAPVPIETARQYALLMGDHRLLPRMYDQEHSDRIQQMYQKQRQQSQQGAGRKAAPQIAQKEMTSLQRSLEGRA